MKRTLIALVMCGAFGATAETPQEGATAILKLLKDRNYTDLFSQRYSEWHKVEASGKTPEEAVKKLSALWERNYDMMVTLFEQLSKAEYKLSKSEIQQKSETGDMATGTVSIGDKTIPYRLYKMKNGRWGFHM